ncbi:hypothetical protein J4E06_09980 [Muricauda sp. NFXS6]|uniref:hypothetical protein n=1 Tax=Allomuricauda sp. NFXS6 TaxID=2819094 RepID=UPI0032DE60B7
MFKLFKNSHKKPSLHQLDQLYGQAICKCPLQEQISYCQRLIESSRFQLEHSCPKKDSNYYTKLIEAAHAEIERLRSKGISR